MRATGPNWTLKFSSNGARLALKRVLVVFSEFMLGVGIESLLQNEKEISVQSITLSQVLSGEFNHYQPNVVILDETVRFSDLRRVFELLQDCPELRVMVINLQDNRVSIYDKHEILISRSKDLVSAIQQVPEVG